MEARAIVSRHFHADHGMIKKIDGLIQSLSRRMAAGNLPQFVSPLDDMNVSKRDLVADLDEGEDDLLHQVQPADIANIPTLEEAFEHYYSCSELRNAHRTALEILLAVQTNQNQQQQSPMNGRGSAREPLNMRMLAAGSFQNRNGGQRWVQAMMRMAKVMGRRGLFSAAIHTLEQVVEMEQNQGRPDADARLIILRTEICIWAQEQGDYDLAHTMIQLLDGLERDAHLHDDNPVVSRVQYARACMLMAQGAFSKANLLLQNVIRTQQARLAANSEELLLLQIKMIELAIAMTNYDGAVDMLKGLVASVEKSMPPQTMVMAEIKYLQACIWLIKADYKEADDVLREAARIVVECVGKPLGQNGKVVVHPLSLKISKRIAEKSLIQGRYDETKNILDACSKNAAGTDLLHSASLTIAELKEVFALLSDKIGKPKQAMDLLTEAYDMRKDVPGALPDSLLRVSMLVAQQEINMGCFREAQATTDSASLTLEKSQHQSKLDRAELLILQVCACNEHTIPQK
jgi:tetratricopeptide (TPR) repeat protein